MKKLTLLALPLIALLGLGTLQSRSLRDFLFNALNPFPDSLALTAPAAVPLPPPATKPFLVFDATLYKNKPALAQFGLTPLKVVYEGEMWKAGQDFKGITDQAMIQKTASSLLMVPGGRIALNIETWPLTGPSLTVNNSLAKCLQTLTWFRTYAPKLKIGYYAFPPLGDYWRAINGLGPTSKAAWQKDNDNIQSLANSVDIFYPSLYTFYTDKNQWVQFAIAQITEARRLAKGKPVYPFIWPQYHDSNPVIGLKFIPDDYWKLELDTIRKYADGVVIWGGYDLVALQKGQPGGPLTWDNNASWWKVTKNFLATIKRR